MWRMSRASRLALRELIAFTVCLGLLAGATFAAVAWFLVLVTL